MNVSGGSDCKDGIRGVGVLTGDECEARDVGSRVGIAADYGASTGEDIRDGRVGSSERRLAEKECRGTSEDGGGGV